MNHHRSNRRRRSVIHRLTNSGRGFTLIETMLAAMLGSVVVAATLGLFTAMQRADRWSQQRALTTGDLTMLHGTCARTLRTLVLNSRQPSAGAPAGAVTNPTAPGTTAAPAVAEENTPDRRARIILEPDGVTGLQRLEVVVAEPPIFGRGTGAGNAFGSQRGALEFRMDEGETSYAAYWVSYDVGDTADRPGPKKSEVKIASGISKAQWRFMVTGEGGRLEPKTNLSVTEYSNLPAYAELDIAMADGREAKWMFELMWSTASEPGVVLASSEKALGPNNRPSTANGGGKPSEKPTGGGEKPRGGSSEKPRGEKPSEGSQMNSERTARETYLQQLDAYERGMRTTAPRKPNSM